MFHRISYEKQGLLRKPKNIKDKISVANTSQSLIKGAHLYFILILNLAEDLFPTPTEIKKKAWIV